MQWTGEQARAIDARGGNLLLSAAAGSGKTTVLVARVMKLIEEGAGIDRMLVVTFTNAAASDMRAKLSRKLAEAAAAGDARCREQMIALERASITTLHAFCADFLRTNFERAGVDPAFRILDDAIRRQLMDAALDEAFEEAYAKIDSDEALRRLDYGRGPKNVRALVESLVGILEERPDPDA
ncbi:MAG: UvrD-helicase domain-containing protein, partial [Clostridia bacterium]|nr:UvrD-helicase domain-containing protein [Clostridia bacterium]